MPRVEQGDSGQLLAAIRRFRRNVSLIRRFAVTHEEMLTDGDDEQELSGLYCEMLTALEAFSPLLRANVDPRPYAVIGVSYRAARRKLMVSCEALGLMADTVADAVERRELDGGARLYGASQDFAAALQLFRSAYGQMLRAQA